MKTERSERLEKIRHQGMEEGGFGPQAMMGLKVCPYCGSTGAASQFFCKACGHRLPRTSLYQRYKEKHRCCPTCDTVLPNGARYCPQCGEQLEQSVV